VVGGINICIGATPEELEEIKQQEMEAKMKKEALEQAEVERQEEEEAGQRKQRHNEWVRLTTDDFLLLCYYVCVFQTLST